MSLAQAALRGGEGAEMQASRESGIPEQRAAEIRAQVRARIMEVLPQPLDPVVAREINIILAPLLDDIVAQCQKEPQAAEAIIATAVSGIIPQVRTAAVHTEERMTTLRHENDRRAEEAASRRRRPRRDRHRSERMQFDVARAETLSGEALLLSDADRARIDATMLQLFESGQLPPHASFVMQDGEGFWRIELEAGEGEQARYVLIPARDIRLVTVARDAHGRYKILELNAPVRMDDESGALRFERRDFIWHGDAIRAATDWEFNGADELNRLLEDRDQLDILWESYEAYRKEQLKLLEEARADIEARMQTRIQTRSEQSEQSEQDVAQRRGGFDVIAVDALPQRAPELPDELVRGIAHWHDTQRSLATV